LINWITPIVQVVHVFSGVLSEGSAVVSRRAFLFQIVVLMFNSPAEFSTRETHFHWYRPSHFGVYLSFGLPSVPSDMYTRRPLVLVPAMTLLSTFSNVWEVSSHVLVCIPRCHSLME
jgi:hypothetical protein